MLASVYSYRVMVKSVSCCCVRGRWVLSNPVAHIAIKSFVQLSCFTVFKPTSYMKVVGYIVIVYNISVSINKTLVATLILVMQYQHCYIYTTHIYTSAHQKELARCTFSNSTHENLSYIHMCMHSSYMHTL